MDMGGGGTSASGTRLSVRASAGRHDAKIPTEQNSFSPFDHANRPHPRHLARQSRPVHDFHDVIDVLVRLGLLLRQAAPALRSHDDPFGFQLLVDATAGGFLDGGPTAERTAGAVTGW